jgi:hypothetical protein
MEICQEDSDVTRKNKKCWEESEVPRHNQKGPERTGKAGRRRLGSASRKRKYQVDLENRKIEEINRKCLADSRNVSRESMLLSHSR